MRSGRTRRKRSCRSCTWPGRTARKCKSPTPTPASTLRRYGRTSRNPAFGTAWAAPHLKLGDHGRPAAKKGTTPSPNRARTTTSSARCTTGVLMGRLLRYLNPYKLQAGVSVLAILLKSATDVAGPVPVKVAIDTYMRPTQPCPPGSAAIFPRSPTTGISQLGGALPAGARDLLPARARPDLPDAVDRAEDHVRPARADLPAHPVAGRRLLRPQPRRPAGDARYLRRRRDQRNVHLRRAGHLRQRRSRCWQSCHHAAG